MRRAGDEGAWERPRSGPSRVKLKLLLNAGCLGATQYAHGRKLTYEEVGAATAWLTDVMPGRQDNS